MLKGGEGPPASAGDRIESSVAGNLDDPQLIVMDALMKIMIMG